MPVSLSAADKTELKLTPEEQHWLSEHRVLKVASNSGWAPVSYMGENGEFSGIAIDHFREIEKILGVQLVFLPQNNQKNTSDIQIISAITNPKINTPVGYIASEKPYISNRLCIFTRLETKDISNLEDLHGKRVVVFQNRVAAEMLERDHPQIKLIRADIAEEALATLINGNVEAYVGSIAIINYVLNHQGVGNVKLSGLTPYSSDIFMAVSGHAPELASVIKKAMDAIPESKHNEIDERWVKLTIEKPDNFYLVITTIALLMILLFFFGLRNKDLLREVNFRKQAEKDIAKSHGMIGDVLNTIPIGVFWMDIDGRYMGCNRTYAYMVGLDDPQSILGKHDSELPHGLLWSKFEVYSQLVMHESTPVHVDVEKIGFHNKGGITAKTELVALRMPNGEAYGILVTIEDISPLRDSEERSRAVFESSLDCLVTIDSDGLIVSVNPAVEKTFGYSMTEMLGNKMKDLIVPPDMREAHEAGMKRYIETNSSMMMGQRIEIMAMRKGGEVFPVELTIVPFEARATRYFLGTLRDISDRKNKELQLYAEELQKSALLSELDKMRRAIDQHNSIVVTDRKGVISYVNEKFCDISGYINSELVGRTPAMFKSGLHSKEFYANLWGTILSGQIWNGVIANKTKNGAIYWLNASIFPVLGDDGEINQFISIRTDITETHNLQEALEQSIEREYTVGFQIQQALLYGPAPIINNVQISAFTEASLGVDGDFYDIQMLTPTQFDISIGDVMGKGTAAALIAAAAKQKISHALVERYVHQKLPTVAEVVELVRQQMVEKLIKLERFLTLFYCRVDIENMRIHYVDAGHGLAFLANANGVNNLSGENLPIGVSQSDAITMNSVQISEGDILFLYSDGVTDAINNEGMRFGENTLHSLISEAHSLGIPACVLTNLIEQEVLNFEAGQKVIDDRTIIAIRIEKSRPNLKTIDLGWNPDSVSILRSTVGDAAAATNMSDEKKESLILAAVESLTNILRHAKHPSPSAAIHCRIETLGHAIKVDFFYVGQPFTPRDDEPDFSGESDGGYGLYIVKNSVNKVEYLSPMCGVCCIHLVQELRCYRG